MGAGQPQRNRLFYELTNLNKTTTSVKEEHKADTWWGSEAIARQREEGRWELEGLRAEA